MTRSVSHKVSPVVALFGGSFDPPHQAHCAIPEFLLTHQLVDQVWYVPVKNHPFGGKQLSADHDRVEMVKLCITSLTKKHPSFINQLRIETWELEQNKNSYTIQTLDDLSKKYPQILFRWVIGTDNLAKFHLWQESERIASQYGVLVYPRAGYPASPMLPGMVLLDSAPEVTVSSTDIRNRVKNNQALDLTVLPEVRDYVAKHQLYR